MMQRHTSLKVLVLVSLMAVPALGQNLLTNPTFLSGTGNAIDGWVNNSGSPLFGINNNYPGGSPGQDNDSRWVGSSAAWAGGTKTPELRQMVTVVPQTPYLLSVWVNTGGSPHTCSAFLQWKDGVPTSNGQCTTVASITTRNTSGWEQLSGTVMPTGTQLTICLKLSWDSGSNGGGGNFDNASVSVDTACPNSSTVTGCAPASIVVPPYPAAQTLTISGTNLSNITGVKLTGPATIPGTIVTGTLTNTSFQATFDLTAKPIGDYNVTVTRNLPCLDATLAAPNGFTLNCISPATTVDSLTAGTDVALTGTTNHKLTMQGTNLTSLTGVSLHKSNNNDTSADIVGTGLTMVGSDLQATFNLTGAEAGRYDVVCTHPCGSVTSTITQKGFLVYLTALTNGGFEEGYKADATTGSICANPPTSYTTNAMRPKPTNWDRAGSTEGGFHRDGNTYIPDCVNGVAGGVTGEHYAGIQVGSYRDQVWNVFQTIEAPNINATGLSIAPFNIRADFCIREDGDSPVASGAIRLIDGTEATGTEIVSAPIPSNRGLGSNGFLSSADYNAIVPTNYQYISNPPLLTVAIQFHTPKVSDYAIYKSYGLYADNVRTGPFFPPGLCHTPSADADGDGDVDQSDFAVFQLCYNPGGPIPVVDDYCTCFDRDGNSEVDQADFNAFDACASGPGLAWASSAGCP
jgi:hypothetical protein